MKKMILALAVIGMAVAANAASFKWIAANVYGADGNKFTGDLTLMAYVAGGSVDDAFVAYTEKASAAGGVSVEFSNDSLVAGKTYDFFFTAEQVIEGVTYSFTSAVKGGIAAQATSTPNISFGNMATATQASGAWAAVPEPTSGLLLLLGVAGLALRRKQK